jgi:hypothetical protein
MFSVTKIKEIFMMSKERKDFKEVEECREVIFFLLCSEGEEVDNNKVLKKENQCNTQLRLHLKTFIKVKVQKLL